MRYNSESGQDMRSAIVHLITKDWPCLGFFFFFYSVFLFIFFLFKTVSIERKEKYKEEILAEQKKWCTLEELEEFKRYSWRIA